MRLSVAHLQHESTRKRESAAVCWEKVGLSSAGSEVCLNKSDELANWRKHTHNLLGNNMTNNKKDRHTPGYCYPAALVCSLFLNYTAFSCNPPTPPEN